MEPLSLSATLDMCLQKAAVLDSSFHQGPLRCLRKHDGRFEIVPFTEDKFYIAVSYSWPSQEFSRLHTSNEAVEIHQDDHLIQSSNFTKFMSDALKDFVVRDGLALWLDYHCINQRDSTEKDMQVAAMDSIFSNAAFTAVMLEDVSISREEFEILKREKKSHQRERHLSIVRRILSARLFTRAWCSQESLLSRKATIFVHHTDNPSEPISFGFGTLRSWMDLAIRSDPSIPRLYQQLPIEGPHGGTFTALKSFAWAYGVVLSQNCFNVYDKVSLTLNLMRVSYDQHIIGLPNDSDKSHNGETNVTKILNLFAVLQKDYSLLQANHYDQHPRGQSLDLLSFKDTTLLPPSFTWAGIPISGDRASERWHAKRYDTDLDPDAHISSAGLIVRGLVARIESIRIWKIARSGDQLNIKVNDEEAIIDATYLQSRSESQTMGQSLQVLHDIVYAIEAFDAKKVFPFFVPTGGNWEVLSYEIRGSILQDATKRFINPSSKYRLLAAALSCLQQDGVIKFDELRLLDTARSTAFGYIPLEYTLITNHSPLLKSRQVLFQPYIMRPKVIDNHVMTSNLLVLDEDVLDEDAEYRPHSFTALTEAWTVDSRTDSPEDLAKEIQDLNLGDGISKTSTLSTELEDESEAIRVYPSIVNLRAIQLQLSRTLCREARFTIC